MIEKRYICRECGNTYKTLTWFNKHVQNKKHNTNPLDLFDIETVEKLLMNKFENRLKKIELDTNFMKNRMKNITITQTQVTYQDTPIERIKKQEEENTINKESVKYQQIFAKCVKDLQEILKLGIQHLKTQEDYEPEIDKVVPLLQLKKQNNKKYLDGARLTLVKEWV